MKAKDLKVNIYTSCYSKMLNRKKNENDFYIQISRSLFMLKKSIDGKSMQEMIDINLGNAFGMYSDSLEDYEKDIDEESLKELVNVFNLKRILEESEINPEEEISEEDSKEIEKNGGGFNFFLLCFEDLDTKYTERDEKKYGEDIKAGMYKTCHRTVLAKMLNKKFGLNITEW